MIFLSWFGAAVSPASANEALNLLFFGNSFSQGNVHLWLANMAAGDGHAKPTVLLDSMGGQDLDYHIGEVTNFPQNNVNHSIIAGKTWDFVVIQPFSTEATTNMAVPGDDWKADALNLYHSVRDHSSGRGAGVQAVLFQTWARQHGHVLVNPNDYRHAWDSSAEMQSDLSSNFAAGNAYINAADGAGTSRIAPVGDAFQARNFELMLYGDDLYHPSAEGTLLASMILYRSIYDENISGITFTEAKQGLPSWMHSTITESEWDSLAATADSMTITAPVPEPGSTVLIGLALPMFFLHRSRMRHVAGA